MNTRRCTLLLRFVLLSAASATFAACGAEESDDPIDGSCPAGPEAPLGVACSDEGLRCAYGYDPIECGGRTVECTEGVFVEFEHTDPMPSCFEDAGSDAGEANDASETSP